MFYAGVWEPGRTQQWADTPPQYSTLRDLTSMKDRGSRSPDVSPVDPQPFHVWMEPHYWSGYEQIVHEESYREDATPLEHPSHLSEESHQQTSNSPLPSAQLAHSPRPREFGAFQASNPHTGVSDVTAIHRTQSIGSGFRMRSYAPRATTSRPRRRPRPLDEERLRQPLDSSMLYPQLSPYDNHEDDLGYGSFYYQPRSVSQPVTPGLAYTREAGAGPLMTTSPDYTASGNVMRGGSRRPADDAAFHDEHEFRLFVEATAGLGPVPDMDRRGSSSEPWRHATEDSNATVQSRGSRNVVSPLAETPTTIEALQHIAQMPQSRPSTPPRRPNLQSFGSDFETWLQPPPLRHRLPQQHSMPHMSAPAPVPSWQDWADDESFEDELPDYAASQAQAQAAQRIEATRRAQELQRRWQESGSRPVRYA